MAIHSPPGSSRATTEPETETETRSEAAGPPLDVVYDLLSNERRRRVLRYLLGEAETTLGELAEHIATIENDKPEGALSSSERKRVYIVLYQCHLPRMDDAGVIDFDEDRKTVEAGENLHPVMEYLPGANDAGDGEVRGWRGAFSDVTRAVGARLRDGL